MSFRVLDSRLERELEDATEVERKRFLFLEPHSEYPNHFRVQSFDPFYVRRYYEDIGDYQAVSIWNLPKLATSAEEDGCELVFLKDPQPILDWIESLDEPYPYELGFELKKFQTQGFNFFRDSHADILDWSTGTGKSAFSCAKARYLLNLDKVDKVVIVSKAHARLGWQRELLKVAGLDSTVVGFYLNKKGVLVEKSAKADDDGARTAAEKLREFRLEQYSSSQVLVINYEKFRDDEKELTKALRKQRVYFVFDEMPTKLKSPTTALYKATRKVIKTTKERYGSLLSATPIENIPEDLFYCVKLLDPYALPEAVKSFRERYYRQWDFFNPGKVAVWDTGKLRELGMRLAHMTHTANKYTDPEIAAQFPISHEETIPLTLHATDRRLYDAVLEEIISDYWDGTNLDGILAKMLVLQLICNNPATIQLSDGELARKILAKRAPSDAHAVKLEALRDLIERIEGKIVLFTMYNDLGAHPLSSYLTKWGISHVLHDGSARRKQAAIDTFQNDPTVRCFISSDQGSDSINLDAGSSVINFDLPWKYSTKLQRVNRINRITSLDRGIENVYFYDLIVANSVEERKQVILERKRTYLEALGQASVEQAEGISALSRGDLWFILTGNERD